MLFLEKLCKNVRKHRDMKIVTTERRRNYFISKPNYHTSVSQKVFHRKCISNRSENKSNIKKLACLFRIINIRSKYKF